MWEEDQLSACTCYLNGFTTYKSHYRMSIAITRSCKTRSSTRLRASNLVILRSISHLKRFKVSLRTFMPLSVSWRSFCPYQMPISCTVASTESFTNRRARSHSLLERRRDAGPRTTQQQSGWRPSKIAPSWKSLSPIYAINEQVKAARSRFLATVTKAENSLSLIHNLPYKFFSLARASRFHLRSSKIREV